jgi:hypothetical protein
MEILQQQLVPEVEVDPVVPEKILHHPLHPVVATVDWEHKFLLRLEIQHNNLDHLQILMGVVV